MAKYRKKPVVIEAIKLDGLYPSKIKECVEFLEGHTINLSNSYVDDKFWEYCNISEKKGGIIIHTLEGDMLAKDGDYIIRGVNGEFYPCKPDIFEKTYELADKEVIETAKAVVDAINKSQGYICMGEKGLR